MILLTLLLATFASAETCLPHGKIRFQYRGEKISEKSSYCFDETRSRLESLSCRGGKCQAKRIDVCTKDSTKIFSQVGSPGFAFCQAAGGVGQILEFFDGEKWWELDRCFFKEDGSYLDTGSFFAQIEKCQKR